MINRIEQRILDQQPTRERMPLEMFGVFRELWERHCGSSDAKIRISLQLDHQPGVIPDEYISYAYKAHEFTLALEHLVQTGIAGRNLQLFNESGRIHKTIHRDILRKLFLEEKILRGVSACAIGGPEGRVFAEMGADVVNIDPQINKAPRLDLPNLQERAEPLTQEIAKEYQGRFDVTISSRLFDFGSGLVPGNSINRFTEYFQLVMEMTKRGGISIHDGEAMPYIIDALDLYPNLKEVALNAPGDRIGDSTAVYVLQR